MNGTVAVPRDVHSRLLAGFIASDADQIIRDGGQRGDVMIGDGPGEVFAWLWESDRGQCMMSLAGLVAELRKHNPEAPEPPIRLTDVLDALRLAFPHSFPTAEKEAFAAAARSRVPRYGSDPDE